MPPLAALLRAWRAHFGDSIADIGVWSPVAIGVGIGVYFSLQFEPSFRLSLSLLALAVFGLFAVRRFRYILRAIVLAVLGFAAADYRTLSVKTEFLTREIGFRTVAGEVLSIEDADIGQRILIKVRSIEDVENRQLPTRARISWRGARVALDPGDIIRVRANLRPPPPPSVPGGFDFARQLYFQQIGAVGYAVSVPQRTEKRSPRSFNEIVQYRTESLRSVLAQRIMTAAPGQGGAIVAAVVTGKRSAVNEASKAALRDAGLTHLLAISGLHMGLATGIIFFIVRASLAAVPPLAIRLQTKKIAAVAALAAGFFYLLLSGAAWSPRRAFLMTAIILVAILLDRRALSLRNIAIAATIILLTTPEALLHPGFQMSFAAAAALIACFEFYRGRQHADFDDSLIARFRRYGIGLVMTDLIASIATAPFAIYHFNRVAIYSLSANVLAMPIMAFWIMPAAVIGMVMTAFGLDGPFWVVAAAGVDAVLFIGATVAGLPGAVALTAQWPPSALLLIVSGGLWMMLTRTPLRLLGLLAGPVAAVLIYAARPPDLLISNSGDNAAVVLRQADQLNIAPYRDRKDRFAVNSWREVVGAAQTKVRLDEHARCDAVGCVLSVDNRIVSIIEKRSALDEDCARAEIVVALFPVSGRDWRACKAYLIDKRSIWRRGAHAVWFTDDETVVRSANEMRGVRPWTGQAE